MSVLAKSMPSKEVLEKLLYYDPEAGKLYWKINQGGQKAGIEAGWIHTLSDGRQYRRIRIQGKKYLVHRIILEMNGYSLRQDQVIDHENGDGLDNRPDNLRACTHQQNTQNSRVPKNNKTGHKGVSFRKDNQKYYARITHNGRASILPDSTGKKYFDTIEEPIKLRKAAEEEYNDKFKAFYKCSTNACML